MPGFDIRLGISALSCASLRASFNHDFLYRNTTASAARSLLSAGVKRRRRTHFARRFRRRFCTGLAMSVTRFPAIHQLPPARLEPAAFGRIEGSGSERPGRLRSRSRSPRWRYRRSFSAHDCHAALHHDAPAVRRAACAAFLCRAHDITHCRGRPADLRFLASPRDDRRHLGRRRAMCRRVPGRRPQRSQPAVARA